MSDGTPAETGAKQGLTHAPSVPAEALRIAALTPFTTIDYPGKLSAVIFVQGCPWRCIYCQNAWMQSRQRDPAYEYPTWPQIENLLSRRHGLLDGVVFSGGEPCADPALPAAVKAVKAMGYLVGLHTGGAYPRRFASVLPDLDWVGLDVKALPTDAAAFERITGRAGSAAHFLEAFSMLRASGVPFECRSTVHPDLHSAAHLLQLADWLETNGVDRFALQIYRKPPQALLSVLPSVGVDYPSEAVRERFRTAVAHYEERRE